jgi:hypothetical protein
VASDCADAVSSTRSSFAGFSAIFGTPARTDDGSSVRSVDVA